MIDLSDIALITWSGFGLFIVNSKLDIDNNNVLIQVEVPKSSTLTDVNGVPMCGEYLAKRFKRVILDMTKCPEDHVRVQYKENSLNWDEEMSLYSKKFAAQRLGYPPDYIK